MDVKNYALLDIDGNVVNIIVATKEFIDTILDNYVECDDTVIIGMKYENGEFIRFNYSAVPEINGIPVVKI